MKRQAGNALVYILVAIVLFAALGVMMTRQLGQGGAGDRLDDDRAALHAGELLQYATSVRNVVEQMQTLGNVLPGQFDFVKIGESGYDTAPHSRKVHHPAGGGLSAFLDAGDLYATGSAMRGWQVQQNTNVSWSYTPATDILYSFVDIDPRICAAINQRLYRDPAIPEFTRAAADVFTDTGINADFDSTDCTGCSGRASLCVRDVNGDHVFYNVILVR